MARRPQPLAKAVVTIDDLLWKAESEACAREAAKWLKLTVNIKRPIDTLKLPEIVAMTQHIISHWIVLASKREAPAEVTEAERDAIAFLA